MNRSRPPYAAAGDFFARILDCRHHASSLWLRLSMAALLTVGAAGVRAQTTVSIEGRVFDAIDGHPVYQASVRIRQSDYLSRTDAFGRFRFENVPAGACRLEVTAEGYEDYTDDIVVTDDFTARVAIALTRRIYELPEREVRAPAPPVETAAITVITRDDIEESDAVDVGEVLSDVPGVYVRESGPSGGKTLISIRGSEAKHVLVLLDGQRLTGAGNGDGDVSTIPIEMVEKIEVYRGGESARYGTDAVGGVINIITIASGGAAHTEAQTEDSWGKWKTNSYRLSLRDPIRMNGVTSRFTYSFHRTDGDFDYRYAVSPRNRIYSGGRLNDGLRTHNYFATAGYRFDGNTSLTFSGQIYTSRQGLPGAVSSVDTTAWKRDSRTLGSVHFKTTAGRKADIEADIGASRFEQYFNNVDHPYSAYRYEDRYLDDLAQAAVRARYRPVTGNEMIAGVDVQRDIVRHENLYRPAFAMGKTVRDNAGFHIGDTHQFDLHGIPFWQSAAVDASVRWDNVDTRNDDTAGAVNHISRWSQKAGISVSHGGRLRVVLRASYGTSFRLPSINALFWKGDIRSAANPGLRPERAEHSDAGIETEYDGPVKVTAGTTFFHTYVRDLIVWQPAYGQVWTPVNLDAALISGHEDYITARMFDDRIRIAYRNTITVAKNRGPDENARNKILTYRPHYVTRLDLGARYGIFRGSYSVRLVDIRYSTDANTKWYDAYRDDDAGVGVEFEISTATVKAGYRVKNLNGEDYELIGGYPMPGREWGIDLSLTYKL